MELEFFCMPGTDLEWFSYWRSYCHEWLKSLGIKEEHLRLRDHKPEELAHYSKATTDFEYLFPFGWGELWGVADRTDFDLKAHQTTSGKSMEYLNPTTGEKCDSVCHRAVPRRGPRGAGLPVRSLRRAGAGGRRHSRRHAPPSGACAVQVCRAAAVKRSKCGEQAGEIYDMLSKHFMVDYDETGSIGKRYRRQDEIGTPYVHHRRFRHAGRPAWSPCATATPWSRITCMWTSWSPTSRRRLSIDSTKDRSDAGRDVSFPRPF